MHDWIAVEYVRNVVSDRSANPDRLLSALSVLAPARERLRTAEAELIDRARRAGLTWREIAGALDLHSPQAAAQRAVRRADVPSSRAHDLVVTPGQQRAPSEVANEVRDPAETG